MSQEKSLAVDLAKQQDVINIAPNPPILSSQLSPWNGISLEQFKNPASSIPEHYSGQHVLAISSEKTHVKIERCIGEQKKSYFMGNGALAFIPANASHWAKWDRAGEFTIINLSPQFVERVALESINVQKNIQNIEFVPQFTVVDPFIQQIAFGLTANIHSGYMGGSLYGESAATMLAVHLLQKYSAFSSGIPPHSEGLHPHRLQQVIDYVNEYLDQDIKLTDLAECAGMSQYYFVHLFKQAMGITPHQYLIQQRVERAKLLLKLRNVVISDIAFQCGFNSQSHLTRIFRQFTGMTPKAYREN